MERKGEQRYKTIMKALELLQLAKKHVSRCSNVEINPVAIVIIELHLSECIKNSIK